MTHAKSYVDYKSKFVYHKNIGFPESIIIPERFYNLEYSKHALERQAVKYDNLKVLPTMIQIFKKSIVEIHTDNNIKAEKLLLRLNYDKTRDIVLALQLKKKKAIVITFWLNDKKDTHPNIDKTKYNQP